MENVTKNGMYTCCTPIAKALFYTSGTYLYIAKALFYTSGDVPLYSQGTVLHQWGHTSPCLRCPCGSPAAAEGRPGSWSGDPPQAGAFPAASHTNCADPALSAAGCGGGRDGGGGEGYKCIINVQTYLD